MKLKFKATKELKTYEATDVKAYNGAIVDVAPHRGMRLLKIWPRNFFPPTIPEKKIGKPVHPPLKFSNISVITIQFWPSDVLEKNLLPSLPKEVEFIKLDNENNKNWSAAAKALNYGIKKAKNDVIILAHEDTVFGRNWFSSFIKQEHRIKNWGALGIVGWDFEGKIKWGSDYLGPYKVQRLDECCIIVNRKNDIWFDEETFKNWHSHGADFCYQCLAKGLEIYILAGVATHAERTYSHNKTWFDRIGPEKKLLEKKWGNLLASFKKKFLKVDIMIPTYNRPKGLRRAIKSVLNQNSPNWELYIYNDGSDYDFDTVEREFKDNRIHWLGKEKITDEERCEVGHISKLRNVLAEISHNKLLLWLDDDDHLWPEAIEKSIKYFQEHPESKIIFGKMTLQYPGIPDETPPKAREIQWPRVSLRDPYIKVGTPQVVMRREVLDYTCWPTENLPEGGILEDAAFFRKLGEKYLFHYTDILMANAHWHQGEHGHAILTRVGKQLQKERES